MHMYHSQELMKLKGLNWRIYLFETVGILILYAYFILQYKQKIKFLSLHLL